MNTKTFHNSLKCIVAIALLLTACLQAKSADATSDLCVMTYNLRFANNNPGEVWATRRPIMVDLIKQISPDVFGTQEGLYSQINNLATDLSDYEWIGLGREGGSKGEFMAIFYRKSRLEPLAYDHFWLSDTPEVMASSTWGNKNKRMVTWIKFKDLVSGQEFYFWNTHFDNAVQEAREKSATLVRKRIEELNTQLPLLLVGDFNSFAEQTKAYTILTADDFLKDLWKTSPQRVGEGLNTFNGFKEIEKKGKRIDWILARGPVTPESIEINTFSKNGQFPSDHCPVAARIKFGPQK